MKKRNGENSKEEILQGKAEAGEKPATKDEIAYALVFRALNKQVEIPLSDSFADRVAFLARERQTVQKKSLLEYVLFSVGILLLAIALMVTIQWTAFKPDWGFLSGLKDYKGLFILGAVMVIVFNLIDVRVIRKTPI